MKKIIFVAVFLCSIKIVNADGLVLTYLPYYIKVNDNDIIRVRKITENSSNDVLFNIDFFKYELTGEMKKGNIDNEFENLDYFNTIVYFGYNNSSKKYLDYFFTQVLIWELYSDLDFIIVDKFGNELNDYNDELNNIKEKISNYYENNVNLKDDYNILVGETLKINYDTNNLEILNASVLSIEKTDNNILINSDTLGSYDIILNKEYDKNNYLYTDGKYTYYASLGGPASLFKKIKINVKGINVKVKENYNGVNNKYGDSILESKYGLYKNGELIKEVKVGDIVEILPNTEYILKDISENKTIYKNKDILLNLDRDYELNVNKYIISKNIKVNVEDDYTYNIYLKSNNELYEVINKNIKEIILPYGLYYIVCKDIEFYDELEVFDDNVVTLKINNEKDVINQEKVDEDISENEEIIENLFDNDIEEIPDNPKTLDNIHIDFLTYLCCLTYMGISFKKIILK